MGRLFAYYILFSMLIYDSKNHLDRFNLFKSTPAEHEIRVTMWSVTKPFLNSQLIFYAAMISQKLFKIFCLCKVVQKMSIYPHFM